MQKEDKKEQAMVADEETEAKEETVEQVQPIVVKKNEAQEEKRRLAKEANKALRETLKKAQLEEKQKKRETEKEERMNEFKNKIRQQQLDKIKAINQKRNIEVSKQIQPVFMTLKGIHKMNEKLAAQASKQELVQFFNSNVKLFEEGTHMSKELLESIFDTAFKGKEEQAEM